MTWKSHIAIASALVIPFNPALLGASVLGATAPDWSEWVLKFFGINVKHRGATHYLIIPLGMLILSFMIDFNNMLFWFSIGYLSHWVADSMTIMGVPLSPYDKHKIHLFGGKLKTGEITEYIIAFSFLGFVLLIFNPMQHYANDFFNNKKEILPFNVYYMDYKELYDLGIIDEQTYKEKRFKLF